MTNLQFNSIQELKEKLTNDGCTRCSLGFQPEINGCCVSRGSITSQFMIIGEAPGKTEDSNGLPFSGPAGQLLDKIFASVGWNTNDWYVTNVVKCRPYSPRGSGKENFTPKTEQQKLCRPYLEQEMAILKPKIVLLLGKTAVNNILPDLKKESMTSLRGKAIIRNNCTYFIMYHPAFILHSQYDPDKLKQLKEETWADIQTLKDLIEDL
jgi:uracil-DNA glycosylase